VSERKKEGEKEREREREQPGKIEKTKKKANKVSFLKMVKESSLSSVK
jgi:hypothetical protein